MNDITVNLQIIQILIILGGGIATVAILRSTMKRFADDMVDVKKELKGLSTVLVTMAVTSKRLDNLEEDVRDMKHGRGFIAQRSEGGVNGEWP